MKPTANEACDWLLQNSCRPIKSIRPVKVTIRKNSYVGAFYSIRDIYIPTERAVTEKKVLPGEERIDYRFYLIGDRPKIKRSRHCFTWESGIAPDQRVYRNTNEWYVCCHSSKEQRTHVPWKMFMLSEWLAHAYGYYEGHKIDTLERFKYDRVPMTVQYLD